MSPAREDVRVKYVALVAAFGFRSFAHQKKLAQIAGGSVQAAVWSGSESGNLTGAGLKQFGEFIFAANRENVSAISGAGQQAAVLIEGQGINEIFS